jgi:hypothetical protein
MDNLEIWTNIQEKLKPKLSALDGTKTIQNVFKDSDLSKVIENLKINQKLLSEYVTPAFNINSTFNNFDFEKHIGNFKLPNYEAIASILAANQNTIQQLSANSSFKIMLDEMSKETPYNFSEIRLSDQLNLIQIASEHSFGIIECIPTEILYKFLDATNDYRSIMSILVESREVILQKCDEIASYLIEEQSNLEKYGAFLKEGISAIRNEHYSAAQALLTVTWDSFIGEETGVLSSKAITHIRRSKLAQGDILAAKSLSDIYSHASYAPVVTAFQRDSKKIGYSRNATVHHASRVQMNPAHAMCALTIAVGVVARKWRLS